VSRASAVGAAEITARYAHLYDDPKRAAVERVAALIEGAGKPAREPIKLAERKRKR
jgi:hypothetical protein